MKVKIFNLDGTCGNRATTRLEDQINEWFDHNQSIDVIDQKTTSCSVGNAGNLNESYTVCIFYKKK